MTYLQQQRLWEHLHGQHVHEESGALETLQGDAAQHLGGGQDGRADDDNIGMILTEVIKITAVGGGGKGRRGAGRGWDGTNNG